MHIRSYTFLLFLFLLVFFILHVRKPIFLEQKLTEFLKSWLGFNSASRSLDHRHRETTTKGRMEGEEVGASSKSTRDSRDKIQRTGSSRKGGADVRLVTEVGKFTQGLRF